MSSSPVLSPCRASERLVLFYPDDHVQAFLTIRLCFKVPYMLIQNKKPFEFASFPFSLIRAIISNYQNHVRESVIYSWRACMKYFSLPNMLWNLSCWKRSVNCLCKADSGIGSAGGLQHCQAAASSCHAPAPASRLLYEWLLSDGHGETGEIPRV